MTYVVKRDGRKMPFDTEKIKDAILKAFKAVDSQITDYAETKAENIANYIEGYCEEEIKPLSIEEIQDLVENGLMSTKRKDVAKAYIKYRDQRTKERSWNNVSNPEKFVILRKFTSYGNHQNKENQLAFP